MAPTTIFGALGIQDTDYVLTGTTDQSGQRVIYDEVVRFIEREQAALDLVTSIFVSQDTEDFKFIYKQPTGGELQEMGFAPQGRPGAVKAFGEWEVAFPLYDYGVQLASDWVTDAYMTAKELDIQIQSIRNRNVNTTRRLLFQALMRSTANTFSDPKRGALSIQGLANGDAVVYSPVIGATTGATENHLLASGYTAANISDTNDPITTIVNELEEHFGTPTAGTSDIVVFINNAQNAKISALTKFVETPLVDVRVGAQTAVPTNLPTGLPGRVIGRHGAGAWIVEWRSWPADYIMGIHRGEEPPLVRRVDPAGTGLPRGLTLISEDMLHPFRHSVWHNRFGFGAANRLNGVIVKLTTGSYDVPAAYQ